MNACHGSAGRVRGGAHLLVLLRSQRRHTTKIHFLQSERDKYMWRVSELAS
jgi:hypothetical protein